jgi:hypothetical protein
MIGPSSGDAFARRRAATAGRGAVRLRRATPLMGGKVFGHNLHSRLTRRSIWQEFGNTGVEPCPPGSPRRVFRARVGVGSCAFWVVAARRGSTGKQRLERPQRDAIETRGFLGFAAVLVETHQIRNNSAPAAFFKIFQHT